VNRAVAMNRFLVCIVSVALLAGAGVAAAQSAVGRTQGTFAVSPTGAATYTIPIWAPRGPNGLQPNIALIYNSQEGIGPEGVGWSIAGLSSIYRCNQTYAQDAAPGPITLTMSDVYCLDGQRLRLTSGTYGEAGSTYQTEVANFANVTAYGSAGNGPAYFTVQTANGLTYQYGNDNSSSANNNSQVLANGTSTAWTWMLNEVSDRAGNTMQIAYTTATGTVVPSTISWTPSSSGSSTYNYTMQFTYGDNVAQSSPALYIAGTPVQNPDLLESITVSYTGTAQRTYTLTYQQSPTTGRDELMSVEECGSGSGSGNCFPATTFTYQNGSVGLSTSATTPPIPASVAILSANYDFNGDGYRDLIYVYSNTLYVTFGSASGYSTPVSTGIPVPASGSTTNILLGDLLGTGKDGILVNNGGTWYYYTWNGSSFVGTSTGLAFDTTAVQFAIADINGDGLPDLVALYQNADTYPYVTTRLNTSSGGTVSFSSTVVTAFTESIADDYLATSLITPQTQSGRLRSFDFNGDGRQDLVLETIACVAFERGVCAETGTTVQELISQTGGTFDAFVIEAWAGDYGSVPQFANVNDDACTDYINTSAGNSAVYISACNGSAAAEFGTAYYVVGTIDWNGDGRTDLLEENGSALYVQLSTGTGFGTATEISVPPLGTIVTFDANGDGLDDLGAADSAGNFVYYLHNDSGQPPDLLSQVTDGYGNWASPIYAPISWPDYGYAGSWNDQTYPYESYVGPLYVAYRVTYNDPSSSSGGTYGQQFWYADASMNLQGRGFAGFGAQQRFDSRSGIWETWGYTRTFPYTGMLNSDLATLNNSSSQQIFHVSYSLAATTLDGTAYNEQYFPYVSSATTQRYQVTGNTTGPLIETDSTNYSYDDYGNATSIVATRTDEDSGSPYYGQSWTTATTNTPDPDTSTWCLNLFTETQVAYTASSGSPVTLTKQFTPDTTNCRYTQVVTQPSSAYQVTESFSYDAFGNIDSDTVTGTGMAARQTTANWGTTGQFPMSATNPSGTTTNFNYNFNYGLVSSVTDPNHLTTSWQYDGFGRKNLENRPDGTYTQWTYTLCSGCDPLPRMVVTEQPHDSMQNVITTTQYYFDMLDRPLYELSTLLNGLSSWTLHQLYNSTGQVQTSCFPYPLGGYETYGCQTYSYDVLNRLVQAQRPISSTNGTLQTTTYSYSGPTTTVTDPLGNTQTTVTDVNGWLRQTADAYGYTITLGYDAAGNRTSAKDSLNHNLWTGTYAYGVGSFLVSETDADLGSWSYTVDALGERTGWTDAKGQSFSMTYDPLSRPLTRTEPDLFTQWTWGSSASAYNVGKLECVCTGASPGTATCTVTAPTACSTSPGYSETETYDSVGRPSQRAISLPAGNNTFNTFTYTWQYNATTGLLNTLTYPMSASGYTLQLQYGYDYGALQSITDVSDSPNVTIWQADAGNPAGQVTEETLGNGIVTNRAYDGVTHWLGSVQSGVNGGSGVKNLAFLYDLMGDVTQRQDNNLGLTENIYYDDDYRFSTSQLNSTQNLSVSYDAMGDITSRSDVAGGATWTYDAVHLHAVDQAGSNAYAYGPYDANGNPELARGAAIGWSSYNYPTTLDASTGEELAFSYGPDRQRWQQIYQNADGETETTDYIGGLMEQVSDSDGGPVTDRDYIYAGTEPVAVYSLSSSGNALDYFLTDQEGSVSAITNSSGNIVVNESFTAFGERRNPTTWSGSASSSDLNTSEAITRQAYTFQMALGEDLGLTHMNGRVQDAIIGRFLSPDPYIQAPSNAQNYNRYSYTLNNPLTFVDPSGFETCIQGPPMELGYWVTIGSSNQLDGNGFPILPPVTINDVMWTPPPICFAGSPPTGSPSPSGGSTGGAGAAGTTGNTGTGGSSGSPPTGNTAPSTPQTTTQPPKQCIRYGQVIAGTAGALLGAAQGLVGGGEAIAGLAAGPETFGATLAVAGNGIFNITAGSVAALDGLNLAYAGLHGTTVGSTLGSIGAQIAGANGQSVGDGVTLLLGVASLGSVAQGNVASAGLFVNAVNFVASSVASLLPAWARPCP
jgi:RHS repeat-associated protein